MEGIITAWGRILRGYKPSLSIEITRECPLRCPGCYAYGDEHLGGDVTLRQVTDYKGQELVDRVLAIVDEEKPLHVSIVGGEPLVRYRELQQLLPLLAARGIYSQLVTSAVRPIPAEFAKIPRLQIVVSIDGLQPEHDVRRAPATYDRIQKHIAGHQITVHCTVTRQQVQRDGYLEEFLRLWSARDEVAQIWVSLYTPQVGEVAAEILGAADRERVVAALMSLRTQYKKLAMPEGLIKKYANPPQEPGRVRLRAHHELHLGGLRAPHHAVPVRRHARLLAVRMHRVGGARRGQRASAARRPARRGDLRDVPQGWQGPSRQARVPSDGRTEPSCLIY